jgi:hypothetical protein
LYYKITEEATTGEEKNPNKLKIQKIAKPNYEPLPEDLENSIAVHAIEIN